jgi:hypothetical protein
VESIGLLLASLVVLVNDGVSGVVPTSAPGADVRFSREDVGELSFTLVTPLGSKAVRRAMMVSRGCGRFVVR